MNKRKTNIKEIKSQLKEVNTELKNGVFIYTGPMILSEFAAKISKPAVEIITFFFKRGEMINLNATLTDEQIIEICLEYGYDFQKENAVTASNLMHEIEIVDDKASLVTRPPIITVMGHVDHGKTTLIDRIRNTNIVAGEAGGITQHTGSYQIDYKDTKMTFIDTPGHEAFTAMRARGSKITDIVILVVAADDGVMPQTKESIDHANAADVPIIIFINKMDKQNADPEKVKSQLSDLGLMSEEWGGEIQYVYGSALKGEGIDLLFEQISIQAEILELKANPSRLPIGIVVESNVDKGRGSIATLIVQNGTLTKKDFIVAGSHYGRIRTLENMMGEPILEAKPGTPVIITGLNYSPLAGEKFVGFIDEKYAKSLANKKAFEDKQNELKQRNSLTKNGDMKVLNIIVKADTQGTTEAVKHSLVSIENDEAKVRIISASVGVITKTDVLLAEASNATIFSFNIRATGDVKQMAETEKVNIKQYTIIYKMIEDVEDMISGMRAPKFEEKVIGQAKILKVIFSSQVGNIAGSVVVIGVIKSGSKMRLIRDGKTIYEGMLDSLQKGKNSTKKITKGSEFGTHIKKYNDIKIDDIIETYEDIEMEYED